MLAKTGAVKTCGFFLSGINEDRLSEAYRNYSPGGDFLGIPIWLSSGQNDTVAKPQDHNQVKLTGSGPDSSTCVLSAFPARASGETRMK